MPVLKFEDRHFSFLRKVRMRVLYEAFDSPAAKNRDRTEGNRLRFERNEEVNVAFLQNSSAGTDWFWDFQQMCGIHPVGDDGENRTPRESAAAEARERRDRRAEE